MNTRQRKITEKTGLTLLEMMLSITLFTIFIASFSSTWVASRKQIAYVVNRSRLLRESFAARTWLSVDFSSATAVALGSNNDFTLTRANNSLVVYTLSIPSTMHYGRLLRYDSAVANSTMTVANHVSAFTSRVATNQFTANYEFSASTFSAPTNSAINLCMYWNKISQ